ncbi:unnamed protein product [Amaranthus hypochondriacus]
MGSSHEQERWEKNDQELKRLSTAIEEIHQKQEEMNKKNSQTDDKLAAILESQTKLLLLFESKSGENPRRQPTVHILDQEETNLEWVFQKERSDRRVRSDDKPQTRYPDQEEDLDAFFKGFGAEFIR